MNKRTNIYLIIGAICFYCFALTSCGVKKKVVESEETKVESTPAWHTCLFQGARATVTKGAETYTATVTMQTVRDSMIVISVMPLLGMEMLRLEATPLELTGIDKLHGQYAKATFADLNRQVAPPLNWDVLQQICSAELPTGPEHARLVYFFGNERLEVVIDYPERRLDVPVRVNQQPVTKYRLVDISRWL